MSETPSVPRQTRGTLTLSNSISINTLVSAIILYESCTIAISKYLESFLSKNYVCIIAFMPNLQRAFF
jgi:hypothetical protein